MKIKKVAADGGPGVMGDLEIWGPRKGEAKPII